MKIVIEGTLYSTTKSIYKKFQKKIDDNDREGIPHREYWMDVLGWLQDNSRRVKNGDVQCFNY